MRLADVTPETPTLAADGATDEAAESGGVPASD
jgi:hypothetical protein